MNLVLRGLFFAALSGAALAEPTSAVPTPQQPAEQAGSRDEQIARLIEQLGNPEYYVRQGAQAELAKCGFEAFDALTAASANEDLEIAARARYLLRLMRVEAKDDPPEVRKLLSDYEGQTTPVRVGRMRALADLPEGAGLPALCRLVRYEKSSLCSKQAAAELLRRGSADNPPSKELAVVVQKSLSGSSRPAAQWLLAWLRFGDDPKAALAHWASLIEEEQARLRSAPTESGPEIVAVLIRFQIGWLKKLGETDKAVAAMYRLLDLEEGDPETLAELLDWLVAQKAWKVVAELAARFHRQFQENALLLYTLAEAYAAQGEQPRAEATAQQAQRLNPGKEPDKLFPHYITAYRLRQRGLFAWAEQEYRHVMELGGVEDAITAGAYCGLSEMFHDQGDDLQAAKILEKLLKAGEKETPADRDIAGRAVAELRSRMHYLFASHFQGQGDQAQRREHLLQALQADPVDIDALIACYHCGDLPAEKRQEVRQTIRKMSAEIQEQISDDPKNADTYNQFAWLIGNTEGDLDLAVKYSKKSLELSPSNGGYYDTLAHVYATKGDYQSAVQQQARAAELDPHSGQIVRELKAFREKLPQQNRQTGTPSP
jgi:tetratricopeptide (TPR) repeat protein